MTLDKAIAFANEYAKFITTLWYNYTIVVIAMIGWVITLRINGSHFYFFDRSVLMLSYIVVSLGFGVVLRYVHIRMLNLIEIVQALALKENDKNLRDLYIQTFDARKGALFLNTSLWGLLPAGAVVVEIFFWIATMPVEKKGAAMGVLNRLIENWVMMVV
jgi:hypothetical protein